MHPMRRKDRQIGEEEARRILDQGEYGVLSLLTPEATPYGVPLTYVAQAGSPVVLYMHCAREGRKLDCLHAGSQAHFVVVGPTRVVPQEFAIEYESVMLEGELVEVDDAAEKRRALLALARKYADGYDGAAYADAAGKATRVLKLTAREMSGKRLRVKT